MPIGNSLKPLDGGPAIAIAKEGPAIEDPYRVIRFVAKDIPPLGYRSYVISQETPEPAALAFDKNAGVMESPFFKAVLDRKRGRIVSLIDKRTGRELVDPAAPQGFGQYFYERFGYKEIIDWLDKSLYPQFQAHKFVFAAYDMPKDGVYRSALPEDMTLAMEKNADRRDGCHDRNDSGARQAAIDLHASLRCPLRYRLPTWKLVGRSSLTVGRKPLGFVCRSNASIRSFALGRLGADVDPVKDIAVNNANYHMFWVNTGVSVYDAASGAGVAVCPQDSPLVSLGEPGEYKFDKRYEPAKPYVYVNLYNNHWRTNFASWVGDGRRMTSRVRLWAFDKFNSEASLYTPGMETRIPLAAARSTTRPGKLPTTQPGLALFAQRCRRDGLWPEP